MFGRFRSAIYSAMGTADGEPAPNVADLRSRVDLVNGTVKAKVKYGYQRPIFLQLFSDDEIQVTADHMVIRLYPDWSLTLRDSKLNFKNTFSLIF